MGFSRAVRLRTAGSLGMVVVDGDIQVLLLLELNAGERDDETLRGSITIKDRSEHSSLLLS